MHESCLYVRKSPLHVCAKIVLTCVKVVLTCAKALTCMCGNRSLHVQNLSLLMCKVSGLFRIIPESSLLNLNSEVSWCNLHSVACNRQDGFNGVKGSHVDACNYCSLSCCLLNQPDFRSRTLSVFFAGVQMLIDFTLIRSVRSTYGARLSTNDKYR